MVNPPTGLHVDSIDGDEITLSWEVNDTYDSQRVMVSADGASNFQDDSGSLSGSKSSYTTTDLLDGEQYIIKVEATKNNTTVEDVIPLGSLGGSRFGEFQYGDDRYE